MYVMNAEDWRKLYAQGSDLVRVGAYTGERLIASTHVPAGTVLCIKDPDEAWARMKPTILKWTIPVWCHKVDRWMSFDLKDKDWSQHLVEWKEFQLEQPEKGCKPVPPDGWEVPDDWNMNWIRMAVSVETGFNVCWNSPLMSMCW